MPSVRRPHGRRPGRKQQFVVVFRIGRSVGTAHRDGFGRGVYRHGFAFDTHVDPEPCAERGWGLNEEFLAFGDRAADVVGQSAVGVGDVTALFEQDDFGGLVRPANPCRRSSAACNASDDDVFHSVFCLIIFPGRIFSVGNSTAKVLIIFH